MEGVIMQKKQELNKKRVVKAKKILDELEVRFPVKKKRGLNICKILNCLFIGNGASLLYSLSVLCVIYGLVGILTPLFCVKDVLSDKLTCIGTLQGYEILLLAAAIIPFVKKKITNDAVSLIIFIAMFLVVGAITLDTISNNGLVLSVSLGFGWMLFAAGKIYVMRKSLKVKFQPLLIAGISLLLLWNYFVSLVIAKYHLTIADYSLNLPLDMWEFWRITWLVFLLSGFIIWYFSISGSHLKTEKNSDFTIPFLHTPGMAWIFTGILGLASMYHQRVLCYVYDIQYHIADFLPGVIIFLFIVAEIAWNCRRKYLIAKINGPEKGFSQEAFEEKAQSENKRIGLWLRFGLYSEIVLFTLPLLLILILFSTQNKFSIGTYISDVFWHPVFLLGFSSAVILHDLVRHKRSYLIYPLSGYLFAILLTAGASYGIPETLNWKLTGIAIILVVIIIGIIRKNMLLVSSGIFLGMAGGIFQFGTEISPSEPSIELNTFPTFVSLGCGMIIFLYLYFKEIFPRKLAAVAVILFCFFIMFCYDADRGLEVYRLCIGILCSMIGISIISRVKDIPCGITMQFPFLIFLGTKIHKINHWHYVIIGFLLLIIGTIYSIYKDFIGQSVNKIFSTYRKKFITNNKDKKDTVAYMIPILIFIFLLLWSLGESFGMAKESARKISCTSNLKCIGLSLRMYSSVYNEAYPHLDGAAGLDLLRSEGFLENAHVYICPSTGIKASYPLTKLTEENTGYCFRGGLTEASSVDSALAWDKPNNHDRYGNILYVDGHVKGYAGANWMDNIK
jgi:prepilin-type processing-associated H-X9-DG protein